MDGADGPVQGICQFFRCDRWTRESARAANFTGSETPSERALRIRTPLPPKRSLTTA